MSPKLMSPKLSRCAAMACAFGALLTACGETKESCAAPAAWLPANAPDPDLTSKSVLRIDKSGGLWLNQKLVSEEKLSDILHDVSNFDRYELIEVQLSGDLPCDRANVIIESINEWAVCKDKSYCRLTTFSR